MCHLMQIEIVFFFQFVLSLLIAACIALASLLVPPPKQFPDIFPLLISIYSCAHFFLFAAYFHLRQFGREDFLLEVTSTSVSHADSAHGASTSAVSSRGNDVQSSRRQTANTAKVKHGKHH